MKTPVILASLLAVAGTATTAHSATAAVTVVSDEVIKAGLKQAVCLQDWDKAIALSSNLITSSTITPEYRQTLVDWRHRFIDYSRDKTRFAKAPGCESARPYSVELKVEVHQNHAPRFSRSHTTYSPKLNCYYVEPGGHVRNLQHICSN